MTNKVSSPRRISPAAALAASTMLTAIPAVAQTTSEASSDPELLRLDSIVTSATRTDRDLGDIPQQVNIIRREDILRQAAFDTNITNIIGQLIPGISPPQADGRTEDFTIRGRPVFLLIDGVPQDSNTGFSTEFFGIDPSAIERIEVVRGASAIYGEGATGGIINIITRSFREEDGIEGFAGATVRLQPSSIDEDATSYRAQGGVSGRYGPISVLAVGSIDEDQGFFDADGNLIPPDGSSNFNRLLNFLFKAGVDIDENQRASLSFNITNNNFESPFTSDPITALPPIGELAQALEVGTIDFDDPPEQDTINLSVNYSHDNLFGSKVSTQFFYRTTDLTQVPSDISDAPFLVNFPTAPAIFQTTLDAEEIGGRILIETPIFEGLSLTYGADLSFDDLEAPFNSLDEDAFDNLQQGVIIANPTQVPPFTQRNVAGFVQFEWQAIEPLLLTGGIRYENIEVDVDDFTASPFTSPGGLPADIQGGSLSTDDVVFNFGAVYDVTDTISVTGNFSQGFSLPSLGFILGQGAFGDVEDDSDGGLAIEAQKVTNYEASVRYNSGRISAALSGFFNTSENGTSLAFNPDTTFLEPISAPQRNFGVEFESDWQVFDTLLVGGSVTWVDGNFDPDDDGEFQALSSVSAPPYTIRVFAEHETLPNWRNRIQALAVGDRDRAFNDGTDPQPVAGYTTLDLQSELSLGQVDLAFGIQNLLDRQFVPASSQTESIDPTRFAGVGRLFTLSVSTTF